MNYAVGVGFVLYIYCTASFLSFCHPTLPHALRSLITESQWTQSKYTHSRVLSKELFLIKFSCYYKWPVLLVKNKQTNFLKLIFFCHVFVSTKVFIIFFFSPSFPKSYYNLESQQSTIIITVKITTWRSNGITNNKIAPWWILNFVLCCCCCCSARGVNTRVMFGMFGGLGSCDGVFEFFGGDNDYYNKRYFCCSRCPKYIPVVILLKFELWFDLILLCPWSNQRRGEDSIPTAKRRERGRWLRRRRIQGIPLDIIKIDNQ